MRRRVKLAVVARLATILGLIVALAFGAHNARRSQQLINSLSTRYVDNFPDNLHAINELIDSAERSLVVVADQAGYGLLSNASEYGRYNSRIRANVKDKVGVSVDFLVYSEIDAHETRRDQLRNLSMENVLSKPKYFDFWSDHPGLKPRVQSTFDDEGEASARQEFFAILDSLEIAARDDFRSMKGGMRYMEARVGDRFEVFFWLADGREAIFSFLTTTPKPLSGANDGIEDLREVSFYTRDRRMIEVLMSLVEPYRTNPAPED